MAGFATAVIELLLLCPAGGVCGDDTMSGYPGFYLDGRHLYDGCGELVVLRGVNKMVWWTDRDGRPSYREIAKSGANAVRIAWMPAGTADELDTAISNAVAEQMIPMVELHSASGKWWLLQSLVDYWTRPDIVSVIRKHERYLLVNIGNEVGDGNVTAEQFRVGYSSAVQQMRAAGIRVPLVIDSMNYGRDMEMLLNEGPPIIEADPLRNVIFSVHMWWPERWGYDRFDVLRAFDQAVHQGLPLIVGEFAHQWSDDPSGAIPYTTIVEQSYLSRIGMFPWSWGPGNNPQFWLDMSVDGTYEGLRGWGREVAITLPYSIKATAIRPQSMIYGDCNGAPIRVRRPTGRTSPAEK